MKPTGVSLLLASLLAVVGLAACPSRSAPAPVSPLLETRVIDHAGTRFDVVVADLSRVDLRLLRQDAAGRPLRTFEALERFLEQQGLPLLAATNAGIFEPGEVPSGLFVQDGQSLSPLNTRAGSGNFYWQPNGVFFIGPRGAGVVETAAYASVARGVRQATQSGPLLLSHGALNPTLAGSRSRYTRSGVGVDAKAPGRVFWVLSRDKVPVRALAEVFQSRLGCTDALYLDGAISRFHPPTLQGGAPETGGAFSGFLVLTPRR
ncbi:phosphodiester glycosidase family protein [Corallococcus llansteffanensis]|nr:phosphodiester glycosidase family protein [Corallococcus llansteffanensis]